MHLGDGHGHRGEHEQPCQRREQPQHVEGAGDELAADRQARPEACRPEAQAADEAGHPVEPRSAERAESLLGSVAQEDQAQRHAQGQ